MTVPQHRHHGGCDCYHQPAPPACHGHPPAARPQLSAGKWLAIATGGSVFLVAFAMSAIAVAISAVALTICLLILRDVWRDIRKHN